MSDLTHLDATGHARMVDVAGREVTTRTATASGRVTTSAAPLIRSGEVPKGDVLAVARIAGIMATKRTPDLIPLCHPIAVHGVEVDVAVAESADEVLIRATVRTADRTGVEMEALTAVAVAGLAVIDMVKAVDPHAALRDVQVEAKDGGRNGAWRR
jgi:cyclic pyranopterin phosphate synthase